MTKHVRSWWVRTCGSTSLLVRGFILGACDDLGSAGASPSLVVAHDKACALLVGGGIEMWHSGGRLSAMFISAVAAFSALADSPAERMYGYLAKANSLSMTVAFGRQGSPPAASAKYGWIWPDRQVIRLGTDARAQEFRQNFGIIHVVDRGSKSYSEFPSPGRIVNPPGDYPAMVMGYPQYHVAVKNDTKMGIKFEDRGKATVEGVVYDHLLIPGSDDPRNLSSPIDIFLDPMGRIVRVHFDQMTDNGPIPSYFTYSDYDLSRSSVVIPGEIEKGFSPDFLPKMHYPPGAYDRLNAGSARDARSGRSVDLGAKYKGKRVAILVTTADCGPSARGENAWRKLRLALEKEDCELIEVVVGNVKPDLAKKDKDRAVYLGKEADLGDVLDVPVTPYLYIANRESAITQVWAGYAPDQEGRLIKTAVGSLKDQP